MIAYMVVMAVSCALAVALTVAAIWLGRALGIVARPGGRRKHEGLIPKLGGVAIVGAFVGGALISLLVRDWLPLPPEGPDEKEMGRFTAVLVGTAMIGLFGLLDDRYELSARPQYLAQLVVSVVAILGLVFIERVNNPFANGGESDVIVFPTAMIWGLTLFWLMGMMNTVNWLDGLDGLVGGVVAIVSTVLLVHMIRVGQYGPALLPAALLGTVLGFLPFNAHPARIFLGSGAVTLGYLVGTLSLVAGAKVATALLVMGIPIADVAWQIVDRWRHGRPIGVGDRGHLHFRLYDLGMSQRQIVALYWGGCALFGAIALLLPSPVLRFVTIAGLGGLVIVLLAVLSRKDPQKDTEGSTIE